MDVHKQTGLHIDPQIHAAIAIPWQWRVRYRRGIRSGVTPSLRNGALISSIWMRPSCTADQLAGGDVGIGERVTLDELHALAASVCCSPSVSVIPFSASLS